MSFQPWRRFKPEDGEPHGWIQWKGTRVCMDFHCRCGAHGHVDAGFAYTVQCQECGQQYELSGFVEAHPIGPDDEMFSSEPAISFVDED